MLCLENVKPPYIDTAAFWYIRKGCKIVARKRYHRRRFGQKRQKKNRNPSEFRRFLVEVTGFEPATF